MKISYNWLKQFIKTDWPAEKTAELLTDLGLEVEGVEDFESVKGSLKGVVVGETLSCKKHPNADRLKLVSVDIGEKEPLQIVCGAPNVDKGQKVPVATIGTVLYDEKGKDWKIKKGKIRGENSFGMICAEDELGLGKSHEGILVLDNKWKPGTPLNEVFEIETDSVFEIGLTPNRADAMSHWGTARDLKAGLEQKGWSGSLGTPSVSGFHVDNRSNRIPIEVKNKNLAPRYCGLTISGLQVGLAPEWLQNRLKAIGITPKNNVVDATNYVLHELGQPLHAFDADKIEGKKIEVKTLPKGAKFTTLDGEERELHEEDLMICDAEKPLCIAGVLGGLESGVTEKTTSIFLESAYFNPVGIRKTAKRHGLSTDASFRFERGIDPDITDYALKRAALLIAETADGEVTSDLEDLYPKKIEDFQVFLSYEKINNLIGQNLEENTIKNILASLQIRVNNVTESGLGLTIPAYRVDVQREVDVIEEVLRVYGYNNINFDKKLNASVANSSPLDDHNLQNIAANQLTAQGFYESIANSLVSETQQRVDKNSGKGNFVEIRNPLSKDLSLMRESMLFSGLEGLLFNLNRKNENLKFFEFGNTYHRLTNRFTEKKHLALLVTGNRHAENWNNTPEKSGFFFMKGIVDGILERFGIQAEENHETGSENFSEGISYQTRRGVLVQFGLLKKSLLNRFGIEQEVLFADFDWDLMLKTIGKQNIKFRAIPKFPSIRRDFALLLDDSVSFEAVKKVAEKTGKKLLKEINLFDVYGGKNLPKSKKSYAVGFTFLDENKTLTDKQVDKVMAKLQKEFESQLGAELR